MAEIERIGPDSPIIQVKTPNVLMNESPTSSISSERSLYYNGRFGDICNVINK